MLIDPVQMAWGLSNPWLSTLRGVRDGMGFQRVRGGDPNLGAIHCQPFRLAVALSEFHAPSGIVEHPWRGVCQQTRCTRSSRLLLSPFRIGAENTHFASPG